MSEKEAFEALRRAIKEFYSKEKSLSKLKGVENSSVFRIGCYLRPLIEIGNKNITVDTEYNKRGKAYKGFVPDLIVHERQTINNIMAVEFKGRWVNRDSKDIKDDFKKLIDITTNSYNYKLGVFIYLNKETAEYKLFRNGKELESAEMQELDLNDKEIF